MLRSAPPVVPLLVAAVAGLAGCSGVRTLGRNDITTYTLDRVQAELRAKNGALDLPEQGIIVKVDKGTRVPLNIDVSAPFASIEPGTNHVRFERDLFVHLTRSGMEISPDGQRWAKVEDLRGLKQLFGSGGGSFAFGAGINAAGPMVTLTIKLPRPGSAGSSR